MTDSRPDIRAIRRDDYAAWRPLWDGYNAFYGRSGATALPDPVTEATWERFFDPAEPVHALVAEHGGRVPGWRIICITVARRACAMSVTCRTCSRLPSSGVAASGAC